MLLRGGKRGTQSPNRPLSGCVRPGYPTPVESETSNQSDHGPMSCRAQPAVRDAGSEGEARLGLGGAGEQGGDVLGERRAMLEAGARPAADEPVAGELRVGRDD